MRAILLDELSPQEMAKVRAYLHRQAKPSGLADLFWIELPREALSQDQADHPDCQPHRFAVELGPDFVKLELFIRPAQGLRCPCAAYATERQRLLVWEAAERLISELSLRT